MQPNGHRRPNSAESRIMTTVTRITSKQTSYGSVLGRESSAAIQDDDGDSVSTSASVRTSLLPQGRYRVYRWRWFMLLSLCLLNISNGMMWLTFSPIPNYTASYYNISLGEVNAFSTAFFVTSLVLGLLSIFILDRFGLKVAVYCGALLNLVGAGVRVMSTIEGVICSPMAKSGFMLAMTGQVLTAAAQPFLLYTPTTLANVWFGPKERAVATGLSSLANPIGIAIVQIVSPHIVSVVSKLPLLLWMYFIPSLVAGVLTLVAFWYKAPPTKPSASLEVEKSVGFLRELLQLVKIPSFWVLLVVWGSASGMFNAFLTLLPQLLCPYGYSDMETGLWGSLMIFSGMVGALLAGFLLDHTKLFKEVTVMSYSMAILCIIWFYEVFSSGSRLNVAFCLALFGFFALPLIPACMEMGVEISYPVSAVISSGLLWSAAQVIGIVVISVSQSFQHPLPTNLLHSNQCGSRNPSLNDTSMPKCFYLPSNQSFPISYKDSTPLYDPTPTVLLCVAITIANFLVLVLLLWPKYKRFNSEKRKTFEKSNVYS